MNIKNMDQHKKNKKQKEINVKELQKKSEEYLNGWKRAQADYQNLQKETEINKKKWIQMASAGLLEELLPIYDNFKLAIKHIPQEQMKLDWVIGIVHIKNQLEKILNDNGIEEIKTVGEKFDVELHEAVARQEQDKDQQSTVDNNKDNNDIIQKEIRAGYKLNGKVLYPAKVIV